ncbi:MAG TPA: TetR/AcrR family transcriptional regulator [Pseudomonadales bacterium]
MSAQPSGKIQRRANILRAARELMQADGDLSFSMRTLAEQAGVSIATPYNLFGSKQAILLAVLDADLEDFQKTLASLEVDEIEVLFEAMRLMSSLLGGEPTFYRNVFRALASDGPEFRFMVSGPRYLAWKRLLRQATEAGLLVDNVDPDAFAVVSSQLMVATLLEWAQGGLSVEEMEARMEYGLALTLLAICTDRSRPHLERHLHEAERKLQQQWRGMLMSRLRKGELDETTRELLADQLKHLNVK